MLAAILVGIPVAIAISIYSDSATDANREALKMDLIVLASKAQEYHKKPTAQGGGGYSFTGLTASPEGMAMLVTPQFSDNKNGTYRISSVTSTRVEFACTGKVAINGVFPEYTCRVRAFNFRIRKIK